MLDALQRVEQDSELSINSPLLFGMLKTLPEDKRSEILDIQPASQGVIDYFSVYPCKLYLPNCKPTLLDMNPETLDTPAKLNRAFVRAFGLYKNQPASLSTILLWDLPNYMDKKILQSMIEFLLPHTGSDVQIHTYIHTRRLMPYHPSSYSLLDDEKVFIRQHKPNDNVKECEAPAYYREALQKLFCPFLVKKSILLSGGLQEYVLEAKAR